MITYSEQQSESMNDMELVFFWLSINYIILYNIKSKLGVVNIVFKEKNISYVHMAANQVEAFIVNLTEQEQLHHINAAFKENTGYKLYGDIIKKKQISSLMSLKWIITVLPSGPI